MFAEWLINKLIKNEFDVRVTLIWNDLLDQLDATIMIYW